MKTSLKRFTGVSVLAIIVAMAPDPAIAKPFCPQAEHFLKRFCERGPVRALTRPQCELVRRSAEALCDEFDIIYATPSADSAALDALRRDYIITPIDAATPRFALSHVVVGPSDLDDADVVALLKDAYQAGSTVAITDSTQDEADAFHRLIRAGSGGANCNAPEIALYGLQRTTSLRPPQESSYCVVSPDGLNRKRVARQWLRDRFTTRPPAPPAPDSENASGPVNINALAKQTHCSRLWNINAPPFFSGTAQVDVFVASLRDFEAAEDYYSVSYPLQTEVDVSVDSSTVETRILGPNQTVASQNTPQLPGTEIVFTEPDTITSFVSSYTNSKSTTVSGSVGYNGFGPNVSVGVGVTVGETKTVEVPPMQIDNEADLSLAQPSWKFTTQALPANSLVNPLMDWVWIVPRSAYPDDGVGDGEIFFLTTPAPGSSEPEFLKCGVPYPFPAWTVDDPVVSSVDPTSVAGGGGTFSIHGENFFPSIVSNVLLAGDALPAPNVQKVDATEINVTLPTGVPTGAQPVQVNTVFEGQTKVSNTNVTVTVTD